MKFEIIEKRKNTPWFYSSNIYLILFYISILFSILNRTVFDEIIPTKYLVIIFFSSIIIYVVAEQLSTKLFIIKGSVKFGKLLRLFIDNEEYHIEYNDVKEIVVHYYSYRHWLNGGYVVKKESGAKNYLRVVFNGQVKEFNFLSVNRDDEKKLNVICRKLKKIGVPIKFYVRGKIIIDTKSNKNF